MFGLEEYLEKEPCRQYTVTCVKNKSEIFYFPKDALGELGKKNSHIISKYKAQWNEFVEKRLQNFIKTEYRLSQVSVRKLQLDLDLQNQKEVKDNPPRINSPGITQR